MNILSLSTVFDKAMYSLSVDNGTIFTHIDSQKTRQSENALVNIDQLLQNANLKIQDIDVLAVNLGPGSFTGIRIGVSLVKGFACALPKIKLIGFDSFELFARHTKKEGLHLIPANKDFYSALIQNGKVTNRGLTSTAELNKYDNYQLYDDSIPADTMAQLVIDKVNKGEFCTINELNPIYLMLSQAENELLKKEARNDN